MGICLLKFSILKILDGRFLVKLQDKNIKPQRAVFPATRKAVVSYLDSTSNHNLIHFISFSNEVVSYLDSTSNHNNFFLRFIILALFHILILHQTTTVNLPSEICCKLFHILILHQTTTAGEVVLLLTGCFISWFYIKPQPILTKGLIPTSCFISWFYIKPQHVWRFGFFFLVVSYLDSTSNHN